MSEIDIRPHHGLCAAFFEGKGYSGDFIRNMYSVICTAETENPDITLVNGTDAICSGCPNNKDGICSDKDKTGRYDGSVLALCGLKYGDTLKWKEFSAAVYDSIIAAGKLGEVCKDCRWTEICSAKAAMPPKTV